MLFVTSSPASNIMPSSLATPTRATARIAPADADRLVIIENSKGQPAGRCALWWTSAPMLPGERVGCIGNYSAEDRHAGAALLAKACAALIEQRVTLAIGPMDGNTWRAHRFVTGGSSRAPFPMEPCNSTAWPDHFLENGFHVIANYSSSVLDLNEEDDGRSFSADAHAQRLVAKGISFRPLDSNQMENELQRIHRLSCVSFAENFLFTPISEKEFGAMYQGAAHGLDSSLVHIAEAKDKLVGFVFAYPCTESGDSAVVVKSLAVRPGHQFAGLGTVLVQQVHAQARRLGYARVIHALQHEKNPSLKINHRMGAEVFRTYALYAKKLAP